MTTVLRNTFSEEFLKEEAPETCENLQGAKSLVRFHKQSGLASQLSRSIYQEVATRWNSELAMLKSVLCQFEEIEALLESRNLPFLENNDKNILSALVAFLQG